MKVTKCSGEGQGSCKRCSDKGKCLFINEHITGIEDLTVNQVNEMLYIRFRMITDVGSKEVSMDV